MLNLTRSLLGLCIAGAASGCLVAPHGHDPSLVNRYREFEAPERRPLTVQLRGLEHEEFRPVAFSRSFSYGSGQASGTAHSNAGVSVAARTVASAYRAGRTVSYAKVTSTRDRDLVRVMLENLFIVDRVVDESYEGSVDLIVEGDLGHNVLDTPSKVMAVASGATLIWLLGFPIYESASGYATLRIYDDSERFLKEYRAQERASRWQPWGGTWISFPHRTTVGPAASTFALAGVIADFASDIAEGVFRVSEAPVQP